MIKAGFGSSEPNVEGMTTLEGVKCEDPRTSSSGMWTGLRCRTVWRLFEALLRHNADWGPRARRPEGELASATLDK